MSGTVGLGLVLLALLGFLLWIFARPNRGTAAEAENDAGDPELSDAQAEIRDLDAFVSPQDAEEELPDWGPGAPKRQS